MIDKLQYANYNHNEVNMHLTFGCNGNGGCDIYFWYDSYIRPPYKKEKKWNYLKTLH